MNNEINKTIIQTRFKNLFEFLRAYSDLRTPVVSDISKQISSLWLDSLPKHSEIRLNEYVEKLLPEVEVDGKQENDVVLEITRPILTPCPRLPEILSDWLIPGWTKIDQKVEVKKSKNIIDEKDGETLTEMFSDVKERQVALDQWSQKRSVWVENEKPTREALALFEKVYEMYGHMEREGERVELLVGDGILEYKSEASGNFYHPILLQHLELEFKPEKEQPQFIFRRKDIVPELYLDFLRSLPEVDTRQVVKCAEELASMGFDPLGNDDTSGFLRRLIQGIFPSGGQYVEDNKQKTFDDITMTRKPVIFMRLRHAGLGRAIDLLLEDVVKRLELGEGFSVAMTQILGVCEENKVLSEEEMKVDTMGNEDTEILLCKPANKEQLQIAKQLSRRGTVLVQGPPGTGKTHTIANLVGHLLSQGKRVLITAQSPKALRVLRREIVPNIQSLCVSVLQKEKQNMEELQQSVRDISIKLSQDKNSLKENTIQIREERNKIINELKSLRQQLFDAREDEIREIVFGGKGVRPIDAAKKVKNHENADNWIPGPVSLGTTIPLSYEEITTLYSTNVISVLDERELSCSRPGIELFPSIHEYSRLIKDLEMVNSKNVKFGDMFWSKSVVDSDGPALEKLILSATRAIDFFKDGESWQLEAIQAGRDGESSNKTWLSLAEYIDVTWKKIQEANLLVMEYGPSIEDTRSAHILLPIINEIVNHVKKGSSLGSFSKMMNKPWFKFLENVKIGGKPVNLKKTEHLLAIQANLLVRNLREELCDRWDRQMTVGGAPSAFSMGEKPEQVCRQYITRITESLNWHNTTWIPLETELKNLGFNWSAYLEVTDPEVGENAQLLRLKSAILGDFKEILKSRLYSLKKRNLTEKIDFFKTLIPGGSKNECVTTRLLCESLAVGNVDLYEKAFTELCRISGLEADYKIRNSLLRKLATFAPAWSSAIQTRLGVHSSVQVPGDSQSAWEWRQLHDELERRASVSLEDLQEHIESLNKKLLEITSELVEKMTWLKQLESVGNKERTALNAYATLQAKKTKGGKGKKDETVRLAARKEMETAKGAVPVWIMPLNEVVDNFNPLNTRFDVVIIDEASQSDPLAMFALYLGNQAVIVGDDEQVTPTAPMIETEQIMRLIRTYLTDIPHKEFYDGETSIYDFAKTVFGNVIRLVEHFRCTPDIIAFSNALSYGGDIKPLREETSISLHPSVVPCRVNGVVADDKTNRVEIQNVAALMCAAIEQPEYAKKTFGVITLLGEQQSAEIDVLLRAKLSSEVYQQRDILCGNAAHFQGDQRDVMFLSMVDSSSGGPLHLRDGDANRKLYKKRYNVAASRAKDQMWLVHSLNHETDLKPGDIRGRFINHMIDPKAWQRERDEKVLKTESPFEEKVLTKILEKGFKVQPQYQVGAYRMDMVVSAKGGRVAIECDGEQWHGPEKLQEDMDRQAILERLGWKFIRIRGSVFFRDTDRAMKTVFNRLEELGIAPERETSVTINVEEQEILQRVYRRAQELQSEWKNQIDTDGTTLFKIV